MAAAAPLRHLFRNPIKTHSNSTKLIYVDVYVLERIKQEKRRDNIQNNKEQIIISKELVTLKKDVKDIPKRRLPNVNKCWG